MLNKNGEFELNNLLHPVFKNLIQQAGITIDYAK